MKGFKNRRYFASELNAQVLSYCWTGIGSSGAIHPASGSGRASIPQRLELGGCDCGRGGEGQAPSRAPLLDDSRTCCRPVLPVFSFSCPSPLHTQSPKSSYRRLRLSLEQKMPFSLFPAAPWLSLWRSVELRPARCAHGAPSLPVVFRAPSGCGASDTGRSVSQAQPAFAVRPLAASARLTVVHHRPARSSFPRRATFVPFQAQFGAEPSPLPPLFYGNTGTCDCSISLILGRQQVVFRERREINHQQ